MKQMMVLTEVEVMIPVKVNIAFTLQARDEDVVNYEQAIKTFLRGGEYSKATVTFGNLKLSGIHTDSLSPGDDVETTLKEVIGENIHHTFKSKLLTATMVD